MSFSYLICNCIVLFILHFLLYKKVSQLLLLKPYIVSLALKITATLIFGYLHCYYFEYLTDTQLYFFRAIQLKEYLISHPISVLEVFSSSQGSKYSITTDVRSFYFIKMVTLINFICGDNYWILTFWFSSISFFCSWYLCLYIKKVFPNQFLSSFIAIHCLPTAIFWSAGIIKESIAVSCLYVLITSYLRILKKEKTLVSILVFIILSYVLFKLKFYVLGAFAMVIIPYYVSFKIDNRYNISRMSYLSIFFFTICVLCVLFNYISIYAFGASIIELVYYNYLMFLETGRYHYTYAQLSPDLYSIFKNTPRALFQSLLMPFPWNANSFLMIIEASLNIVLLALIVIYLIKYWVELKYLPLLIYVLISAIAFGLSSPNWGTLARYKIYYLPCLYFLIFNNPFFIKLIKNRFKFG